MPVQLGGIVLYSIRNRRCTNDVVLPHWCSLPSLLLNLLPRIFYMYLERRVPKLLSQFISIFCNFYGAIWYGTYHMSKPFTYSVRVYFLNTSTSICCIQNHICKFSAAIIPYMSYLYNELTYFYLNLPVPQSPL